MAYGDFKDLKKRTAADKVLRDKAFNIAKNSKYDGYQRGLTSIVYKFFDKKTKDSGVTTLSLHKPIIRKFKKRKVYSAFKDNIWAADLADTQLISKFNKGYRFSLCVIDIYSKYAWVVPLKNKKGVSIVNAFQKVLKESARKPQKIWVDKGSEGKSVVAERFIRKIKNKINEYLTSISENVYIDKLDDIVHKYNNKKHRKIKMKPVDIKDNTYIDFNKDVNDNDPKFKVRDHVRLSKYKSIFAKGYTLILWLKKLKMQFHGHRLLMILMVKNLLEHSKKMSCKRQTNKNLE